LTKVILAAAASEANGDGELFMKGLSWISGCEFAKASARRRRHERESGFRRHGSVLLEQACEVIGITLKLGRLIKPPRLWHFCRSGLSGQTSRDRDDG
jgi:hypothetical protein